jgi:hypothetical protein
VAIEHCCSYIPNPGRNYIDGTDTTLPRLRLSLQPLSSDARKVVRMFNRFMICIYPFSPTLTGRAAFLCQRARLSPWLGAAGGCVTALFTIGLVG